MVALNRPKVCHLTSVHSADDPRIFHKECQTLARAGYEVVLVAPRAQSAVIEGVRVEALAAKTTRWQRWRQLLWRTYRAALRERADVYHFHDPELIPVGALLQATTRARLVYDVHEYYSEVIPARLGLPMGNAPCRFACRMFLEAIPARLFDLLVFPTGSLASAVMGAARHSVTLQNLPTVDDATHAGPDVPWREKEFDVVFVGTISAPRMRFFLSVLQELAAHRAPVRWLFVGLEPAMRAWICAHYDRRFVERHLVLLGRVPYREALEHLRRSRVGFNYHPPEKRFLVSIPMKVFEYMLLGLPAVTTALPELRRVLTHGENAVLVDSVLPADYAAAIGELLSDPDRAEAIGRAGRTLVRESLNWDRSEAPKLLAAYRELTGGGPCTGD